MSIVHRLRSRLTTARPGIAALALTATMWAVPAGAQMSPAHARSHQPDRVVFTVDVAEDFALFNPTLVKPTDTQPERGSFFVTEGNIYRAGTIQGDGATFDPNSAGAIGRWFCRGTHLVAASEIPAAPIWVDTAQMYFLPRDTQSIATEGLEGGGTIVRTVTGATGRLRGYVGEQRQEFLGFNATGGVNLRVTFILRKATK
ncbi:MAG: hypothetical protein GEU99_13420 [Luteitalea sp.]|nr:hypothetical protein [Luteitalea sp.]